MNASLDFPKESTGAVRLLIAGELDQITLKHDYWSLLNQKERQSITDNGKLEVDLSDVGRSDTAGLAWLINLVKDAIESKVDVSFKSVPVKLLNLAELSNAKQILS